MYFKNKNGVSTYTIDFIFNLIVYCSLVAAGKGKCFDSPYVTLRNLTPLILFKLVK